MHFCKSVPVQCFLSYPVHFCSTHLILQCTLSAHRGQVLEALSSLLDNSCTDSAGDSSNPQAAFGPVLEAISEWILEPSRRIDDRCRASSRRQQEIDRRDIASAEAKKGDQNIGLAGYLFGVAYSAGVNLLSGNFSALALGSDAEDETQVPLYSVDIAFNIHPLTYSLSL